jgi:hypothetical protein
VGAQAAVNAPFTISKTGQVVIKNSQSSTVIDATGLVSGTNFANQSVTQGPAYILTNTFTNVTATPPILITLPRQANVLLSLTANIAMNLSYPSSGNNAVNVRISVDSGSSYSFTSSFKASYPASGSANFGVTLPVQYLLQLSAGVHTIDVQASMSVVDSHSNGELSPFTLTSLVLGS